MDDTSDRGLATIVDVGHGAGDGSCGRNTSEERRGNVGQTLCHQLGVGVVVVGYHTIGNGSREQTLDGTQNGDGDGWRNKALDGFPVHLWHLSSRQLIADGEAVADGLDAAHSCVLFEKERNHRHQDDGNERTWNLLAEARGDGDDNHAHHTDEGTPRVDGVEALEIHAPLLDEVGRVAGKCQTEEVLDLGSEDGDGDTTSESHYDRVRDVLDDGAETKQSEEYQEETCHEGGDGETFHAILLDDAIDDDDEGACRTTYLNLAAAKDGDDETCHNGGDDSLFGSHARSDTKCDGQRQGYDTYDDTCHEVRHECFLVVSLQTRKQA